LDILSSKKNNCYAHVSLAIYYSLRYEIEKTENLQKLSFEHYKIASELGSSDGDFGVGMFYFYGEGEIVEKNIPRAIYFYEKAAEDGHVVADLILAEIYFAGVIVPKDSYKAFSYFEMAYNQGNKDAALYLGLFHQNGVVVDKNEKVAVQLFEYAANKGQADAQFNLAKCYEKGIGIEKNFNMAKHYYQLAAANDHEEAEKKLSSFKIPIVYYVATAVVIGSLIAYRYFKKKNWLLYES